MGNPILLFRLILKSVRAIYLVIPLRMSRYVCAGTTGGTYYVEKAAGKKKSRLLVVHIRMYTFFLHLDRIRVYLQYIYIYMYTTIDHFFLTVRFAGTNGFSCLLVSICSRSDKFCFVFGARCSCHKGSHKRVSDAALQPRSAPLASGIPLLFAPVLAYLPALLLHLHEHMRTFQVCEGERDRKEV